MPLATRASIGRGAAAVMAVLTLVGGIVASASAGEDVSLPTALLLVIVGGATAAFLVVVFAPWRRWLSEPTQELLLGATMVVPAAGVITLYVADEPTDTDALFFLAAIFVASALTVRLRWHVTGVLVALTTVAAVATSRGALRDISFVIVVCLAAAALAGLAASVLADTVAASAAREQEASAANQAVRAVVDAARIATAADPDDVLEAVVAATVHLESDIAAIYLLGPSGRMTMGARRNVPPAMDDEVVGPGEGLAGRVLEEGRLVVVNDYAQFDEAIDEYVSSGLRAAMGAPVRVEDAVVGVLAAGRNRPGGYGPAAIAAFQLLADHAGQALALSRLIDEDRQLMERLKSLHALQEDFVATVSHELRTPLTVIDGLAETLETHGSNLTDAQVAQLLSRLRANTTTLATIVTSLLDAARLDRGLVEVEDSVVDLWDLVESCVARLSPILDEHQVELDLDDALVLGDGDLLERVIDNLLTNAQRHTPAGTTVRIEARVTDEGCLVTISDDGPGIPAKDLATITERFTRGGELHTRSTRGLGLGLALADQVLRLHGTRLHVTSPPRTGARFQFRLRLAE